MRTVARNNPQSLAQAALLGQRTYYGEVERVLRNEARPAVRVYLFLLTKGIVSRKELLKSFPDLSKHTLDRAIKHLKKQYMVKSRTLGRDVFHWPMPQPVALPDTESTELKDLRSFVEQIKKLGFWIDKSRAQRIEMQT